MVSNMVIKDDNRGQQQAEQESCVPRLTRKQFIKKVLSKAAVAGTIIAAPVIADTFMAPPAIAQASTNPCADSGALDPSGGVDTDPACTTPI